MKKRVSCCLLILLLLLSLAPVRAEEALRLPIVMYHHISEKPGQWNDYVISPAEFEADLRWLRDHGYETVSLSQLLAWQEGTFRMPEKPCMITFDDGFESTRTYAEPLLAQYGFCGVVAVIGAVCDKFSQVDAHNPDTDNMSWEEVAEMADRGVIQVQCHTWNMHALYPRKGCNQRRGEDDEAYCRALSGDLNRFLSSCREQALDLQPGIAYPYGSYCAETTRTVRELGFRAAFTCAEKVNLLTGGADELYDLGRYNRPHGASSENFFRKWEENA